MESIYRNYPRILLLPSEYGQYVEKIYRMPQMNYITDISAIQIITKEDDEFNNTLYDIQIVTNNFYIDPRKDSSNTVIDLGIYNESTIDEMDLYPDKLKDLQGKELGMAILEYPPYCIIDPLDGMEVRLIQHFCYIHNCTLSVVADDFAWGNIYPNKSGDGILGNVYIDKADFGTGAIYLWPSHYPYLDFSSAYSITRVTCMVPKPLFYPEWQIPFHPFSRLMWTTQVVSVIVAAVILFIINKLARKFDDKMDDKVSEFDSFSGNLIRSFGMSVLQPPSGGPIKPQSPLRLFFTLFETLFLLFTTIYCGALESYLTVPIQYPPIDTIEELYESGIHWAADHEAWVYSIEGATDPKILGLLSKFEIHPNNELERLGNEGEYGLTLEIMAAGHVTYQKHLSADMIFEHHVMKGSLYHTSLITVLRKGGPYSEKFDEYLHLCLSGGLLAQWEGEVATTHLSPRIQTALEISQSTRMGHHYPKNLNLAQIQGALFILMLGLLCSTGILLMEIYYNSYNSKNKQFHNNSKL